MGGKQHAAVCWYTADKTQLRLHKRPSFLGTGIGILSNRPAPCPKTPEASHLMEGGCWI
jgi:hypothetical protein